MALLKHVVDENGVGKDVPMTEQEEAEFLLSLTPNVFADVPSVISDRQFYQQLAVENFINNDEALAAVMTGTIPGVIEGFINALPEDQQFPVRMLFSGATEFKRSHPLVDAIAAYINLPEGWVDEFFTKAAKL